MLTALWVVTAVLAWVLIGSLVGLTLQGMIRARDKQVPVDTRLRVYPARRCDCARHRALRSIR